ncbi:DUF1702 family protein [Ktedonobacter robiniae]|uniref:Enediyne biosynthesis protein n=1 Tax=Ktedonobacter robiniae TaxID=2778365 RepID=A0ABQ3V5Y7_9CHLR|nr:DUF1702 family protein [Ktedonobacter robiniae]GHO59997.1 enediyne biosynthesis protein [Ktedonobacter robiniae]
MPRIFTHLRTSLLGIDPIETTFQRRGFFMGQKQGKERLEQCGKAFVHGYNTVLQNDQHTQFVPQLEQVDMALKGFAYEGAAMALAMLDYFSPWKQRLLTFLAKEGDEHAYMLHVGLGWTFARVPRSRQRVLSRMDSLYRWLALDGYGFHEGYFSWRRMFQQQVQHKHLVGYEKRSFDQGLGRSLWFVQGTDVSRIIATIQAFPVSRQPDLWSGIGLASTYAGGAIATDLHLLYQAANQYRPQLAQGAAFAAKARQRANNLQEETEQACQIFCHTSAQQAASITDQALEGLPLSQQDPDMPAYETWRERIQTSFAFSLSR